MERQAPPELRTPRLTLRPLTRDDIPAIVRGVGNYDVSRWLSVVPYPYDAADGEAFVMDVTENRKLAWGIHASDGLVGVVSTMNELGYWLARPAWRRGYGFEAAYAAVQHWFAKTEADTLESSYFDGNERSGGVLSSLGFEPCDRATRFARSLNQEIGATEMLLTRARWEERQTLTVRGEGFDLRPMTAADAPSLMAMATPEVTRMLFSLLPNLDQSGAEEFIRERQWKGQLGFALAIDVDGTMVGYVACGRHHGAELYYALHPDHAGRGLMSRAATLFVQELFDRFPINRIHADRFTDNPASGAILAKLGFEETGTDLGRSGGRVEPAPVITYALTRDRFKARA